MFDDFVSHNGKFRFMKLIETKPVRLFCPSCSDSYSLPNNLQVKLYQEKRCPLDDFELLLVSSGGTASTGFALCPYCYNNPPFPGMPNPANCSSCLHPSLSFRNYSYYYEHLDFPK